MASDSRIAALTRGLGALAALAVLEAGVPYGLARFGHLPDWAHLADQLTGPDNGTLLLAAITAAGWAAWAWLTLAVLVEAAAALRHRSAPHIRLLGAGQRIAAGLVASVILLLPTTGALAATASPAQAAALHLPQHAHLPVTIAAAQQTVHAANSSTAGANWTGLVHTVRSGDTLWELAEHYLGDGKRWHEIAHLNQGLPQHDGHTLTADTDELHVGWQLRLPHGARVHQDGDARPAGHAAPHVHERVHTVQPGDTLSQIAREDLGDADAYPLIAAANKDHVQGDGRHLTDPDLIYPGWQLTIPQTGDVSSLPGSAGTSHAPAAGAGSHQGTSPGTGGTAASSGTSSTPRAGASSTVSSSPASTAPATGAGSAALAAATPAPTASAPASVAPTTAPASTAPSPASTPTAQASAAATATATATATPERADVSGEFRVGAGITAVLAAGLLAGYAAKRTLQQRRRKPGETIAMPEQVSALEHALHHQAEPSAELLDLALRTLARRLPDGTALPELSGARITADGVEVQIDGEPVPPFTAAAQPGWWRLDPGENLLDPNEASMLDAPYPLLLMLGPLPTGGVLLANLAAHRPLLLDGEPEQVGDVARAIALDAATCPWGGLLQIDAVGVVDRRLIPAMPTGRLHHTDTPAKAVRDLADQLLAAQQDPAEELPWLVVSADGLDAETAWQLADLLSRARTAPVAVVIPTGEHAHLFPGAHRLDCDLAAPQPAPMAGTEVMLQRVTRAEYELLRDDLTVTEQDSTPAEEEWRDVPQHAVPLTDPNEVEADADTADEGPSRPVLSLFSAFTAVTDPSVVAPAPAQPDDPQTSTPGEDASDGSQAAAGDEPVGSGEVNQPDPSPESGQATGEDDVPTALDAPQVRVLGPIELTGPGGPGTGARSRRMTELAAYLLLYPNRSRETAAEAMNQRVPWTSNTVTTRLSDLRKYLGDATDGTPRVGRSALPGHMPTLDGVRCDWFDFEHLAKRGLAAGPAGVADLEAALGLVRGRPFDGATASWAVPLQQEMVSRILDVAHTVAHHRTNAGFFDHARKAVSLGLSIEPAAELLVRDWVALEMRAGNRHALPHITAGLSAALRKLDVEMEPATEMLLAQAYAKADSWAAAAS